MAESTITLRSTGARIACKKQHRSLLDALECNQVCVEYQCREGYCGSCRARLFKGEVCYVSQPLAFIQPGEILLCCCQAKGDVELDL